MWGRFSICGGFPIRLAAYRNVEQGRLQIGRRVVEKRSLRPSAPSRSRLGNRLRTMRRDPLFHGRRGRSQTGSGVRLRARGRLTIGRRLPTCPTSESSRVAKRVSSSSTCRSKCRISNCGFVIRPVRLIAMPTRPIKNRPQDAILPYISVSHPRASVDAARCCLYSFRRVRNCCA